jgi:hypothetical protein
LISAQAKKALKASGCSDAGSERPCLGQLRVVPCSHDRLLHQTALHEDDGKANGLVLMHHEKKQAMGECRESGMDLQGKLWEALASLALTTPPPRSCLPGTRVVQESAPTLGRGVC